MRAVGRPRLSPEEKLDEYVGVAVSAAMRERLEREAHAAGYTSLSRYVREQLFTLAPRDDAHAQDAVREDAVREDAVRALHMAEIERQVAELMADLDRQLLALEDSAPQWPAQVRTHVLLLLQALLSRAPGA